jgi:hypothetical protein
VGNNSNLEDDWRLDPRTGLKVRVTPFHQELTPDCAARAKAVWEIIGGFDQVPSYEVFEMCMCKELHPDQELTAIEWVAERFAQYRTAHPDAGEVHLRQRLSQFYRDSLKQFPPMKLRCDQAQVLLKEDETAAAPHSSREP